MSLELDFDILTSEIIWARQGLCKRLVPPSKSSSEQSEKQVLKVLKLTCLLSKCALIALQVHSDYYANQVLITGNFKKLIK